MVLNVKKVFKSIPLNIWNRTIWKKIKKWNNDLNYTKPKESICRFAVRILFRKKKTAGEQQKYFRFGKNDNIYQYTCLWRTKSVYILSQTSICKTWKLRLNSTGFMDDSFLESKSVMIVLTTLRLRFVLKVGFIINFAKSAWPLQPAYVFYVIWLIMEKMRVVVLRNKRKKCKELLNLSKAYIPQDAWVTELLVSSFSAVELGKFHYKNLETYLCIKTQTEIKMSVWLLHHTWNKNFLDGWKNIKPQVWVITLGTPDFELYTYYYYKASMIYCGNK